MNFLSLFPQARQEVLSPHIGWLLKRAVADSVAFNLVNDIAERYLDNPNTPMLRKEYYILLLEELLHFLLPETDRISLVDRLHLY